MSKKLIVYPLVALLFTILSLAVFILSLQASVAYKNYNKCGNIEYCR